MASITTRNLDDDVKTRLRVRAAGNGRSMEEEARLILRGAVARRKPPRNPASAIRARMSPPSGMHLELPPRGLDVSRRPSIEPATVAVLLDTNVVSDLIRKTPGPAVAT